MHLSTVSDVCQYWNNNNIKIYILGENRKGKGHHTFWKLPTFKTDFKKYITIRWLKVGTQLAINFVFLRYLSIVRWKYMWEPIRYRFLQLECLFMMFLKEEWGCTCNLWSLHIHIPQIHVPLHCEMRYLYILPDQLYFNFWEIPQRYAQMPFGIGYTWFGSGQFFHQFKFS